MKNRAARNQYFVHTPGPPFKILLSFLVLLLSGVNAKAQLMQYQEYSLTLKRHINELWTAERAEFLDIQKGKNWNLIPHVGLAFGLPSVSLNTGQIASYKQRQAETKAKLKSIDLKYQAMLNSELNNLRIEIEKANNEFFKLNSYAEVLNTRKQIFKIYEEAFNKKEMRPLDFYKEKLVYAAASQEYKVATHNFQITILNIERLAYYGQPTEVVYYDSSAEVEGSNLLMVEPSKLPPSLFSRPAPEPAPMRNPLGH